MGLRENVAAKLVSLGLATGIGTDIFLGSASAVPSSATAVPPPGAGPYISLIETGGTGALRSHASRYPRQSLQIVVRASSASVARDKALAVFGAVADKFNVTFGSTFYLEILAVQEVMDMQKDETGRPRFGFNLNSLSW